MRSILHLDLDTFFVSVERLLDSSLIGRPVLVGGTGPRGVVSTASYEARKYGAHSGMPMQQACRLCPEAVVIRGQSANYTKYSKMVTEILRESVPILQKSSIDEFYADLSGMDRYFGCYKYATELRQRIVRETGLPISFGLSENKTVSKIATGIAKDKSISQLHIPHGKEKAFLAPLPVKKIPMVGQKTYHNLSRRGWEYIHSIQSIPIEKLEVAMGKHGKSIWLKANGIDNSPLVEYHERKSISNERTFGQDTTDQHKLKTLIKAMAENLAYQLRKGNKLASCVSIKIRYADFFTTSKQAQVPYTAADHLLIKKIIELFDQHYDSRMHVRLIGVRFSGLIAGSYQMSLFENTLQTAHLYQAMDTIRDKYGSRSIMRASTMGAKTIGTNMNPFNGDPPTVLAHRTA